MDSLYKNGQRVIVHSIGKDGVTIYAKVVGISSYFVDFGTIYIIEPEDMSLFRSNYEFDCCCMPEVCLKPI